MASVIVPSDNTDHVVHTSKEWDSSAMANWPVPRGCLCIELTEKKKTKLKVGVGDKFYRQLPYVGEDYDLSDYYTKEEVDRIIANLNFMSIASTKVYESKNQLPRYDNKLGDVRFVENPNPSISTDPIEYLWNGNKWIVIGGITEDMSQYVTRAEIMPRVEALEKVAHSHPNKPILDQITAPYTTQEKSKLATLKNYDDTEVKRDISQLKQKAHTHANMDILNRTTANYTREEKQKLATLKNYTPFVGTDGVEDGVEGLVPAPLTTDANKFLSSDGTWKTATAQSMSAGDGIEIDDTTSPPTIVNAGVLDTELSETVPGGLTVSYTNGDVEVDPFSTLGKITINFNQDPDD
jgi:hypothetical protein